jgi:hypothetical protein
MEALVDLLERTMANVSSRRLKAASPTLKKADASAVETVQREKAELAEAKRAVAACPDCSEAWAKVAG